MLACLCWPWGSGGHVGASNLILQTLTDQTTLDGSNPAGERQSNHFMANPFTIPLRSRARNARDPRAPLFSQVCARSLTKRRFPETLRPTPAGRSLVECTRCNGFLTLTAVTDCLTAVSFFAHS